MNPETKKDMARTLFNSLSDDVKKTIKKYYVLEIDINKIPNHKFYNDPKASLSYVAIFTTQPRPANAIKKVEEIETS